MKHLLFILFLLLSVNSVFAQADKDAFVDSLTLINGKLIYADSIKVPGHTKTQLDTAVKKWFTTYFKHYGPDTVAKDQDATSSLVGKSAMEFSIATTSMSLVKRKFYLVCAWNIKCADGQYSYEIFDIFFVPESGLMRSISYYQSSPEYLIGLLKKKQLGFEPGINMGRARVIQYLRLMNDDIQGAIASLKTAMAK